MHQRCLCVYVATVCSTHVCQHDDGRWTSRRHMCLLTNGRTWSCHVLHVCVSLDLANILSCHSARRLQQLLQQPRLCEQLNKCSTWPQDKCSRCQVLPTHHLATCNMLPANLCYLQICKRMLVAITNTAESPSSSLTYSPLQKQNRGTDIGTRSGMSQV